MKKRSLFSVSIIGLSFSVSVSPLAAQVVIMPNGDLPPSSVSAKDYPKMVHCTLNKRQFDIEASLAALATVSKLRLQGIDIPTNEKPLLVVTSDGRTVDERRLFIEIVNSCFKTKEGYPLGFEPNELYRSWAHQIGFYPQIRSNEQFADCINRFRPQLAKNYLGQVRDRQKKAEVYSSMFKQAVCKQEAPEWISEKRVRKHLIKLQGENNA